MAELNREGWLTEVARRAEAFFRGFRLPPYRVTCGWPSHNALGLRKRVVGQCHGAQGSKGGFHELFISPVLADPLEVSGTLCHEMAHVAAGVDAAHGSGFVRVCKHVGLTRGKPTQAMPGERLTDSLRKILDKVGAYPHSALEPPMKLVKKGADKTVRLACPGCGCRVAITPRWLEESGAPVCGCGLPFEEP